MWWQAALAGPKSRVSSAVATAAGTGMASVYVSDRTENENETKADTLRSSFREPGLRPGPLQEWHAKKRGSQKRTLEILQRMSQQYGKASGVGTKIALALKRAGVVEAPAATEVAAEKNTDAKPTAVGGKVGFSAPVKEQKRASAVDGNDEKVSKPSVTESGGDLTKSAFGASSAWGTQPFGDGIGFGAAESGPNVFEWPKAAKTPKTNKGENAFAWPKTEQRAAGDKKKTPFEWPKVERAGESAEAAAATTSISQCGGVQPTREKEQGAQGKGKKNEKKISAFEWSKVVSTTGAKASKTELRTSEKSAASAKSTTTTAPAGSTTGLSHRERLVAFYTKHNPSKLGTVDKTLAKFKGREDVLFQKLADKYEPSADTE